MKTKHMSWKDLSYALFMGASLDSKYENTFLANRNREIMKFFSKPIAEINKKYFIEKMEAKLDPNYRAMIKEIPYGQEPIVDDFGRVTYFFIYLGGEMIPIY